MVPVVVETMEPVELFTVGEVDGVVLEIVVTAGDGITAEVEGTRLLDANIGDVAVAPFFKTSRSDASKR